MKADPKYSAGARAERAALRARLRRSIATMQRAKQVGCLPLLVAALDAELNWLLKRQQRYDPKSGGLGKR